MKIITLCREDFSTTLHPMMWESIVEDLGLAPENEAERYPDQIELTVLSAKAED